MLDHNVNKIEFNPVTFYWGACTKRRHQGLISFLSTDGTNNIKTPNLILKLYVTKYYKIGICCSVIEIKNLQIMHQILHIYRYYNTTQSIKFGLKIILMYLTWDLITKITHVSSNWFISVKAKPQKCIFEIICYYYRLMCIYFRLRPKNCIGGVMASVFASSAVDRGFRDPIGSYQIL
jgi:hypothetical protein